MFRRKLNKRLRRGLSLIDGRSLVSETGNALGNNTSTAFDGLSTLNAMSDDDFIALLNSSRSSLNPQEKVLLFDILTLFNSLEVNLNRVIGFRHKPGSCNGLSAIIKPDADAIYQNLFDTEDALRSRQLLNENIEIRHFIAHGMPKKHVDTDTVFFITSNQREWNNKVKNRIENRSKDPELYADRQDEDVFFGTMSKGSIIYPVMSLSSLRGLKLALIAIEKYFSEYAAFETRIMNTN